MKNLIFTIIALFILVSYVVRDGVVYKEGTYYSPRPDIETVCSSCHSGEATCSSVVWHQTFRAEGTKLEVCNPKGVCQNVSVRKGGEWFWHFEWIEKKIMCYY
jgi:hypothetical protein